jgi:uncharacterized membrane protein SirB2
MFGISGLIIGFAFEYDVVITERLWTVLVSFGLLLFMIGIWFLILCIFRIFPEQAEWLRKKLKLEEDDD